MRLKLLLTIDSNRVIEIEKAKIYDCLLFHRF